ncbi:MAG: DsbA family protein [Bifidobacteriaceae bacterium]|jgi:protein-disulfide isomerase|nr:DsbA family protein [Bifidobacteriaceae bacterium]
MARDPRSQKKGGSPPAGPRPAETRPAQRGQRLAITIGTATLAVVTGVAAALMVATRAEQPTPAPTANATGDQPAAPAGALEDGGILIGRDLAPGGEAPTPDQAVTVEIISDFLCPACGLLEQLQGETLAEMAQAGEIRLVIHPINWLGGLNQDYSGRAQTAVVTVATLEPDRFWAFQEALWANRPPESEDGGDLTDAAIAQLARDVGVSQATVDAFADSPAAEWAEWSSDQGRNRISSTPTVYLSDNGSEPVAWQGWGLAVEDADGNLAYAPGDLAAAVAKVQAGQDPNAE